MAVASDVAGVLVTVEVASEAKDQGAVLKAADVVVPAVTETRLSKIVTTTPSECVPPLRQLRQPA